MAYLLAIGSAILYGSADFLGGLASRRASTIAVVLVSQFAGMVLLGVMLMLPILPPAEFTARDLLWGGVAGLAGGSGVALLYRALAIGRMALVAPTTAVCAVVIPVAAAMLLGEQPPARALIGIALAIVAIVLIGQQQEPAKDARAAATRGLPPGLGLALLSGVAIGLFFLALARTSSTAGLSPLMAARVASVGLFAVFAVATRRSLVIRGRTLAIVIAGGATDMLANALYLVATRYGPLSGVVTLASLYPASTVVLARVILGERLTGWQGAGIACAMVAVILIVG